MLGSLALLSIPCSKVVAVQEREGAVRQECEKAVATTRAELSNARQELAVKVALADSWEREVQQLCKRLEKVLCDSLFCCFLAVSPNPSHTISHSTVLC